MDRAVRGLAVKPVSRVAGRAGARSTSPLAAPAGVAARAGRAPSLRLLLRRERVLLAFGRPEPGAPARSPGLARALRRPVVSWAGWPGRPFVGRPPPPTRAARSLRRARCTLAEEPGNLSPAGGRAGGRPGLGVAGCPCPRLLGPVSSSPGSVSKPGELGTLAACGRFFIGGGCLFVLF